MCRTFYERADGMSVLRGNDKRRPSLRKIQVRPKLGPAKTAIPSILSVDSTQKCPVLITGGAGFIGTNLADRLMSSGCPVLIYDNLSRRGSEINLDWLARKHGALLHAEVADVRDSAALRAAVREAKAVVHFAAQVAVTDSVVNPRNDFEVNAAGTLNVLEAIRATPSRPPLIFTSTNKVYGAMPDLELKKGSGGYCPVEGRIANGGISEQRPLDFCSPYGCSKGTADQYVLDYARTFGLRSAVFRMSCIYGPHQFGTEDQGWIAHFLLRAREGKPITIYGDGSQVRDVLYVDDLVEAFLLALHLIKDISGRAFNIGGGPSNTLTLLQLVQQIIELQGSACPVRFDHWRHGDQRYFVSDTREFHRATGWTPRVNVREGVAILYRWLEDRDSRDERHGISQSHVVRFPRTEHRSTQEELIRTS
jgi:CDP-paratose 2-epimerase